MIYANLDMISRRCLLENGRPIHYYLEYLLHASACVRELTKDTLKIINTVRVPVNDYFACDIPMDCVSKGILGVAIPAGAMLQPVSKNDSINPLRVNDSSGNFTTYSQIAEDQSGDAIYYGGVGWYWYWNVSDYGEPTGRYFGAGGGASQNGYKVVEERRQIQFTETFTSDEVVIMYISSGQSVDNASQVDFMAWGAIQAYIDWKRSPNAANEFSPEGRTYYNQRRLLRANLSDLTIADIKEVLRKNYKATIKN